MLAELTRETPTGIGWPEHAETMVGVARLRNIRKLLTLAVRNGVPGDFLEAGVWRGGASIYARHVLNEIAPERKVWACDSFRGLPESRHPEDYLDFSGYPELAVPLEEVKRNFGRYGLLDGVEFVEGWFKDTLPQLDVQLAVLRLDGDLYESTMDALTLYPRVSPGGFVIVDDYKLAPCRKATDQFRARNRVRGSLHRIDEAAVYWQKGVA